MSMIIPTSTTPMNESIVQREANSGSTDNNKLNDANIERIDSNLNSNSNSSSTLNMPSPPLSPYTRNDFETDNIPNLLFPRATKPLISDLRLLESYTSKPVSALSNTIISTSSDQNSTELTAESDENTINVEDDNNSQIVADQHVYKPVATIISEMLADDDSVLHINAYQHFDKPGFKRSQLNFLSQYQFKNFNIASTTHHSTSKYSSSITHSVIKPSNRQIYDALKAPQSDNYNSDSDAEKPRTRRFVRQNKYDLESVENSDNVLSRPTTPISVKKRIPSNPMSPSTPKRQRTATPIIYNYDYNKIEDFCPPHDTLPNNNKCLKTDWKGQSMDLSTDPLVNELHPAEVVLASILRLPCGVYLDSKRRIFQEKVKRMRTNLPFRRTDAQKSCKIDVNKASRLFASFEKVGWFDEKHFRKFM